MNTNEQKQAENPRPVYDPFPVPRTYPEKWDLSELASPRGASPQPEVNEPERGQPASTTSTFQPPAAYESSADAV